VDLEPLITNCGENMFWKNARKKYPDVSKDDPDIVYYFEILDQLQDSIYNGLTGKIQDIGHRFVSRFTKEGKTLEIGFGNGRQARFYKGVPENYYPTDLNVNLMNDENWKRFKNSQIADARNLPFADSFFDQVVSIYNLEHISELEKVLLGVKRVLKPDGRFYVALPCEDGLAWNLGREFTSRRRFIKNHNLNYDKVIAFEHCYCLREVIEQLESHFKARKKRFYPFFIPSINLNLIYCAEYIHK